MIASNRNAGSKNFVVMLWLIFCFGIGIWFMNKMVKGKRQLDNNLDVIGKELKKMEENFRRREFEMLSAADDDYCAAEYMPDLNNTKDKGRELEKERKKQLLELEECSNKGEDAIESDEDLVQDKKND
ncbi:hypothetical protein WA026_019700 [Henosepilachna vigintioctopunctata]|uniref:Uncharacterized protein n=1 Tax=Henosepilachna vigintioctopunctata TaxID=420089 RepID=A0AAW1UNU1_9CUCU